MNQAERMLRAALAYAKHGWAIFPLKKCSKHPAVLRGFLAATTNELTIAREWFDGKNKGGNIGFATGNGILIIDVDVRDGKPGVEQLHKLLGTWGPLPATRQVMTASGGMHYYFAVPPDFKHKQQVDTAIDLKGNGGYVLLPPSGLLIEIAPGQTEKREYVWDGIDGFNATIAELPPQWLEGCRASESTRTREQGEDSKASAPAELAPIEQGCAWMRHCREDAKDLPEPEWYASLSILGRCKDGQEAAHQWSKAYPGYKRAETEKKLAHALTDTGPVTCAKVKADFSGEYCSRCKHWGKITSPIVLGSSAAPAVGRFEAEGAWTDALLLNAKGRPIPNLANAALVLGSHSAWQGKLRYNEFADCVEIHGGPVPAGRFDDRRALEIVAWLQSHLSATINESATRSGVELVARRNAYHPLRQSLEALSWDGVARLGDRFFERYFGTVFTEAKRADKPEDHGLFLDHAAVFFFVSAVARVLEPACRAEHVLLLEGADVVAKSRALEILAGRGMFRPLYPKLDAPQALESLRGSWIVEVPEVGIYDSLQLRAFLARREDKQRTEFWRPSYGRLWQALPRQNVFVVTAPDASALLEDGYFSWRALPVQVGAIDHDALKRDRLQLWGEAVALYRQRVQWYPARPLLPLFAREQRARQILDPLALRVERYAETHAYISLLEMLDAFNVPAHAQSATLGRKAARLLQARGYRQECEAEGGVFWVDPARVEQKRGVILQ